MWVNCIHNVCICPLWVLSVIVRLRKRFISKWMFCLANSSKWMLNTNFDDCDHNNASDEHNDNNNNSNNKWNHINNNSDSVHISPLYGDRDTNRNWDSYRNHTNNHNISFDRWDYINIYRSNNNWFINTNTNIHHFHISHIDATNNYNNSYTDLNNKHDEHIDITRWGFALQLFAFGYYYCGCCCVYGFAFEHFIVYLLPQPCRYSIDWWLISCRVI